MPVGGGGGGGGVSDPITESWRSRGTSPPTPLTREVWLKISNFDHASNAGSSESLGQEQQFAQHARGP